MARFVNSETGSVVNVDDDTAAQLGPEWATESKAKGRRRGSAEPNTFGVAGNVPPVEAEAEPKPKKS